MLPIWLTRPDRNEADAAALGRHGLDAVIRPLTRLVPVSDVAPARRLAKTLAVARPGTWLVLTSPRTWAFWATAVPDLEEAARAGLAGGARIAAVGAATTESLPPALQPQAVTSPGIAAEDLLARLLAEPAGEALLPASRSARGVLRDGLTRAGWLVHDVGLYDVEPLPGPVPEHSAVLLRSPSAARALAELVGERDRRPVFAVGPITAAACRRLGRPLAVELEATAPGEVAAAIADRLASPPRSGAVTSPLVD